MLCTQGQGAGAGVGDEEDPVEAHRDQHRGQGGDRGGHDLCSGILRLTSLEFTLYRTVLNNQMITEWMHDTENKLALERKQEKHLFASDSNYW